MNFERSLNRANRILTPRPLDIAAGFRKTDATLAKLDNILFIMSTGTYKMGA